MPVLHLLTGSLASEDVQAVDEMEHAITVYPIIRVDGTTAGRQRATDVALLLQYIVHLETDGGCPFQESLRKLGIPNKFIAIHAGVRIAATALIGNVGRKAHVPRQSDGGVSAIREGIWILIIGRSQLILLRRIVEASVQTYFEPIVAIRSVQAFAEIEISCGVLPFHLCVGIRQVTHIVGITYVGERIDGIFLVRQGRIESNHAKSIPIAVNVFRCRGPPAGLRIIHTAVTDTVLGKIKSDMRHDTALFLGIICIIEHTHLVGKRGFQPRITLADVQRVGVVGHVEQVLHAGLTAPATIEQT